MALPGLKSPNKKRRQRLKKQRFSALGPGVKNKFQLNKGIRRRAESKIRPQLKNLNQESLRDRQAHQGRTAALTSGYDYYDQKVKEASDEAQAAFNRMLEVNSASVEGGQDTLLAALEASRETDRDQASTIGGVIPEGQGDEVSAMAQGLGSASLANLTNMGLQTTSLATGRIGRAGLARTLAQEEERGKFSAAQQGRNKERKDILNEIPSAKEAARKEILDEEMAKATERSRQKIARESLKLEGRKTRVGEEEADEAARSNRAQESLGWAQIRNERQGFKADIANAGSQAEREAAEAKSESYEAGLEALTNYVNNNKKNPKPGEAWRIILATTRDRALALRIMRAGPNKFRNWKPGKNKGLRKGNNKGAPAGPQGPVRPR